MTISWAIDLSVNVLHVIAFIWIWVWVVSEMLDEYENKE